MMIMSKQLLVGDFLWSVDDFTYDGFGDYGDNLVYEPRPANDLYTLSSSTANLGYSGPGGSYYWPVPQTRNNVTQDENTTPTADNIPVGISKQKN